MNEAPAWHQDEAFWSAFQEFIFPPAQIEQATEQVEQLLELIDIEPGATVLDSPCGVGRHAIELAERGFEVTAVDATDPYLETARERATEAAVEVEFRQADMREFRRPESFDAVINLYTSFGYFADRADDERTARNFYDSLQPDGTLVMSVTSKEIIAGKFQHRTWDERDGTYVLEEHEIQDNWSWMENRWIIVSDGDLREFTVSHRLYSAFELTGLLERVGFTETTVYGDLDGTDYDENANRLVVVARK